MPAAKAGPPTSRPRKNKPPNPKKDLLIDFTGSDWCGWCIKLNDEVFKHEPFKAGVKDNFVLVELDFPKDKSKLTEETQKQNEDSAKNTPSQGYPTIILCDADGRPYAATGYQAGGPEKYVTHLNELRGQQGQARRGVRRRRQGRRRGESQSLVAALDAMELSEDVVANFYGDVVEQIKAADPKDETGLARRPRPSSA